MRVKIKKSVTLLQKVTDLCYTLNNYTAMSYNKSNKVTRILTSIGKITIFDLYCIVKYISVETHMRTQKAVTLLLLT